MQHVSWTAAAYRVGRTRQPHFLFLVTGLACLRKVQPCQYCFRLLSDPKMDFSPHRGNVAPINVKFGTGSRSQVRSPCQISRLSGQKCGNTAPKIVKISNFGHKFVPQGALVCTIFTKFSALVRVSRQILTFQFARFRGTIVRVITIFLRWGHFSTNFQ